MSVTLPQNNRTDPGVISVPLIDAQTQNNLLFREPVMFPGLSPTSLVRGGLAVVPAQLRDQESKPIRFERMQVRDELYEAAEECKASDWDGQGALPVTPQAYQRAYHFIETLPDRVPSPSVATDPDGNLTFEWYRTPERNVSVSVSSAGELHYAALLGSSKSYGTEPLNSEFPEVILALINRVIR